MTSPLSLLMAKAPAVGGIALRSGGTAHGTVSTSGSNTNYPLTTTAHDCIVIAVCAQGTGSVTVTAAGATVVEPVNANSQGPELLIFVLYNLTAGQTQWSATYGASYATYSLGMFSGVQYSSSPVLASNKNGTSTTSETSWTTPGLAANAGDLLVAAAGVFGPDTWSATTWSNSQSTHSLGANSDGSQDAAADFIIPTAGATIDAVYAWSSANNVNAGIVRLAAA